VGGGGRGKWKKHMNKMMPITRKIKLKEKDDIYL